MARHNSDILSQPLKRFTFGQPAAGATHTEGRPTQHTGHKQEFNRPARIQPVSFDKICWCILWSSNGPSASWRWPLQDIVLLQSFYARINHSSIAPSQLHCPHNCNAIARLLRNIRRLPEPPFACHARYHIGNDNIVHRPILAPVESFACSACVALLWVVHDTDDQKFTPTGYHPPPLAFT